MSSTQQLLAAARRVADGPIPAEVLSVAKHCVLDWLGVTLAGAREPAARIVYEQLVQSDRGDEATLLGNPGTFTDEAARAPQLRSLMERIHVGIKPMPATRTELSVQLCEGRVREASYDSGVPERDLGVQGERLARKLERLAPLPAAALRARVDELEHLEDVSDLVVLF